MCHIFVNQIKSCQFGEWCLQNTNISSLSAPFCLLDPAYNLFYRSVRWSLFLTVSDPGIHLPNSNKSPFEKEQSVYGRLNQRKFTDKINGLTMG